jgi:hypothetical protein
MSAVFIDARNSESLLGAISGRSSTRPPSRNPVPAPPADVPVHLLGQFSSAGPPGLAGSARRLRHYQGRSSDVERLQTLSHLVGRGRVRGGFAFSFTFAKGGWLRPFFADPPLMVGYGPADQLHCRSSVASAGAPLITGVRASTGMAGPIA